MLPHATAGLVLLTALFGATACAAQAPALDAHPAGDTHRIERVASGLLTLNVVRGEETTLTIEDRLRFYAVPGVSVAVIDGGRIAWARGWGEVEAGSGVPVDTTTLFQAASISKPVTAAGALQLVEEGRLALDDDVNVHLRSWHVPGSASTRTEKVTLRRLLSHSAGTTVHGFPGYAAGVAVPSVVQILDGAAPANTAPVRVDTVPGSLYRYSGGGTTIVQLLMADIAARDFTELMRERVLEPAGMIRSTFAQPLPAHRAAEAATAHRADGSAIAGKHHTYPEQAAAGLWTTPSDLARFAIEIQRAAAGEPGRILSPEMARLMLTPQAGEMGLGFAVGGEGDEARFGHGGSNAGFQSQFTALIHGGKGAIVMTNGDGGTSLAVEILRSIAREYDIPAFRPNERDAVAVDPGDLAHLVGDYYSTAPGAGVTPVVRIRLGDDGVLRADVPRIGWRGRTLRAAPDGTFFFLENMGELAFERDDAGRVSAVVVTGLGPAARLERRD